MSRQLHGAYYSDVLFNAIRKYYKDNAIAVTKDLLHGLSYFESDLPPRRISIDINSALYSVLSVYHNFLQRGLPTHANILLEEYLKDTWGDISFTVSDTGSVEYAAEGSSQDFAKLLFSALFIIDPACTKDILNNAYWRNWLGSGLEKRFLEEHLIVRLGVQWLQLLEPQRSITNILSYGYTSGEYVKELYNQPIDNMGEQRVDFAVELPCVFNSESKKGLVIEIDGSQHINNRAQFNLDQYRDKAISCLEHTHWATMRVKSGEWDAIPGLLNNFQTFFKDKYFEKIAENYHNPLWQKPRGLKAVNLALTPVAVARIQRVILELLFSGILKLDKQAWKIAIVERDVDCAWIAIKDFKDCWDRLCGLAGFDLRLPDIELSIYNNEPFSIPGSPLQKKRIAEAAHFTGDLLIDISVLQRWGLSEAVKTQQSVYSVTVRSAHSRKEVREFLSAPLIRYQPLVEIGEHQTDLFWDKIGHINYFIRSIFRKNALRPGQLPIIHKALQLGSVIGLLPTGGGKSLTYQLCALLQPGLALVIDPIKSLMVDQNDGLIKNDIDATVFINSSIKTHYERKWAMDQLVGGRVLFAFISPERLQIPSFRASLFQMHETNEKYFSYCIIDEAHCVSEWGHDFRTSYLRLGENARRFCKTWQDKQVISLFGLTATASFDVLSDVKRELQIGDENVVSSLGAHREELIYEVHPVQTGLAKGATGYPASQAVGDAKIYKLISLIKQLPDEIFRLSDEKDRPANFDRNHFFNKNEKNKFDHAVLIFCPHKSERSPMGVNYIAPRITASHLEIGTFYGADSTMDNLQDVSVSEIFQKKFISNELNLLVATKAFGMGIDKPNVRSTVHFNFPSSIESFVQEAGRAGRDRKRAICHILYSNDAKQIDEEIINSFHSNNFKGVNHDYEMMLELLQEITYPSQRISNEIAQKIFEDIGELVMIKPWKGGNGKRLYLNRAFKVGYGYIDLYDLTKNIQGISAEIGAELADQVLDYTINYIRSNCPDNNYYEWIESEIHENKCPGIEILFTKIPVGSELPNIEVGFRNNRINLITRLLKDNIDDRFTEWIVEKASAYCNNINEFYQNLIKEFKKKEGVDIAKKLPLADANNDKLLPKYFKQIRTETDTFKAIYRLSVMGVIDDYEVDYSAKSIKLKIRKKKEEKYLHSLEDYLIRYLSPRRVNEIMNTVRNSKKGSVIRNCAYALVEYVYNFIGKKRARAIKEMQSVCEQGIASQDPREIERTINLYFNSKYTEDILEKTNEGINYSIDLVEEYIEETQGVADNLEHLRGSASRILTDNPDNGALLVLRAYASLLLETKFVRGELIVRSQFLVDKALEDMENGLIRFQENGYNLIEVLSFVREELLTQNPGLNTLLEEISLLLSVKQHSTWIRQFNNQFIS